MACYLPDHLVRCSLCKNLFSDARRLRCSCVYCYLCCLKLVNNYTIYCQCSIIHQFNSQDELEKVKMNIFSNHDFQLDRKLIVQFNENVVYKISKFLAVLKLIS